VVLDLFSREIIGWSMKSTLGKEIVLDAILMVCGDANQQNQSSSIRIKDRNISDEWKRFCEQHQLQANIKSPR
jgi:putative transposase